MKCHKHYAKDAVSQCVDCGKALCPECTNKFSVPLCDMCELSRISANKSLLIKNSIIMVVAFIIGFSTQQPDFGSRLLFGLFCAGVPWGWGALNRITPNIFLFLPLVGWLIYFFSKLVLSMMIGIFITPFKIYGIIKGLNVAKELENYTLSQ